MLLARGLLAGGRTWIPRFPKPGPQPALTQDENRAVDLYRVPRVPTSAPGHINLPPLSHLVRVGVPALVHTAQEVKLNESVDLKDSLHTNIFPHFLAHSQVIPNEQTDNLAPGLYMELAQRRQT